MPAASCFAGQLGETSVIQRGSRRRQTFFCDWWEEYLRDEKDEQPLAQAIHRSENTGRPLGSVGFVKKLQAAPGRTLLPNPDDQARKARKTKKTKQGRIHLYGIPG